MNEMQNGANAVYFIWIYYVVDTGIWDHGHGSYHIDLFSIRLISISVFGFCSWNGLVRFYFVEKENVECISYALCILLILLLFARKMSNLTFNWRSEIMKSKYLIIWKTTKIISTNKWVNINEVWSSLQFAVESSGTNAGCMCVH